MAWQALIGPAIGALMSAFGSSRKASPQTSSMEESGLQDINVSNSPLEEAYAKQFRQQLMAILGQQMQTPLYNSRAKVGALEGFNNSFSTGVDAVRRALGRTGGLMGGGLEAGISDAAYRRASEQGGFLASLPVLERQAQMPLFQLSAGLAGPAPVGNRQVGQVSSSRTSRGSAAPSRPSFVGSLFDGLASVAGDYDFSKNNPFKRRGQPGPLVYDPDGSRG